MALSKPGIAGQISGVLNGVEFASHRGRQIIRNKKSKPVTTTPNRRDSQQWHIAALRYWHGLSDANKLAWETAAQLKPMPDRFGTPRILSGLQLFLTIPHDFRQGLTPSYLDTPPLTQLVITADPTLTWTTPNTIQCTAPDIDPPSGTGDASLFAVRMAKSLRSSNRNWRVIGLHHGNWTSLIDFQTSAAAFNVTASAGEVVHAKIRLYVPNRWPAWFDFGLITVGS